MQLLCQSVKALRKVQRVGSDMSLNTTMSDVMHLQAIWPYGLYLHHEQLLGHGAKQLLGTMLPCNGLACKVMPSCMAIDKVQQPANDHDMQHRLSM